MDNWRWMFICRLLRVIDGDTVRVQIDHGFNIYTNHNIRIKNLHSPELSTAEGKAARSFVEGWMLAHVHGLSEWPLVLTTDKDRMSFNRYVGSFVCSEGHSLVEAVIAAGHGTAEEPS